jgi:hypothetical protein
MESDPRPTRRSEFSRPSDSAMKSKTEIVPEPLVKGETTQWTFSATVKSEYGVEVTPATLQSTRRA